ncbi:acyl--CoA ligase [Paenibacillus mesophilus]|uniref:AMP-binding protein n=1 Tax=Paenibacillus mesophilus TaxID=2582849 RepID=UPI00110D6087|nr:class I adenylate-forming enzyme family protein [Paenibacillus mesophilus]TMV50786.1 acyl--CoA ligase [Paenibacillus mesophilus]
MDNLFWVDLSRNKFKTFREFTDDLKNSTILRKYVYLNDPYEILLNIVLAAFHGKEIELLDWDYSENDLLSMGISLDNVTNEVIDLQMTNNIDNINELLNTIENNAVNFGLALYTSGTTGKPKKVHHSFNNLTRGVKKGIRFENDVWAFAYNPTHIAGLQVFFQAFFNQNTMIYIFDNSNEGRSAVQDSLMNYQVTKISATPTFYRNILTYLNKEIPSVNTITSGGERYDPSLDQYLLKYFPNARIKNIYASTEAGSLLTSNGDFFIIAETLKEKIKISSDNELLIHRSLLGDSNDITLSSDWYNSGDRVELVEHNKFKFVSRNSDFVNIGGYRVNPLEIEELLLKLDCISDILVYGRNNKITGNVLAADIVKSNNNIDDKDIQKKVREYLEDKVQYWKIPRLFRFVEFIDQTRTGKKVRKK